MITPEVEALSFDGDDTLWDFGASFQVAIVHAARLLTEETGREATVEWLQRIRHEVGAARPDDSLPALRRAAFAAAVHALAPDRPELAATVYASFTEVRGRAMELYPEVRAVLDGLAGRLPLALTTNGNADPAWVGLDGTFTAVVRAAEVGVRKPDPGIYLITAERLGVAPERILHIGDHPQEDVAAARAAGLQALLLDRSGTTHGALRSLADLRV